MKEGFIAAIDSALASAGYSERVRFIRDAVYEKLERLGLQLPKDLSSAPNRTPFYGLKEGNPKKRIPNPNVSSAKSPDALLIPEGPLDQALIASDTEPAPKPSGPPEKNPRYTGRKPRRKPKGDI